MIRLTVLYLLAMAWLVSVPVSGTTLLQPDTSAVQSNPAPDSSPAKPAQNTPPKAEPPAAEQGPPDGAEKKKSETAPDSTSDKPAQNTPPKAEPPAAEQEPPDNAEKKKTETAPDSTPASPAQNAPPKAEPPAAEQEPPDNAEKKKTETAPTSAPGNPEESTPSKAVPPAAEPGAPDNAEKKEAESAPVSKVAKTRVRKGAPKARRVRKSAPKPTTPGQPRKVVVREGGAVEPSAQIVPGLPPQEADRQRQHAVQLLASADDNLKRLSDRILDSRQQETVAQIHNYADGARSALKEGDTQRAHTLALKAQLLADDLVKH